MGESHPAEPKVVVEFCTSDLTPRYLNDQQRLTLLKLLGTRYDPDKDLVRMSCEKFTTAAQNKRFLGDLINTLIKEAKEGDSFADVPLDLRHHKPKRKPTFPESWVMTDERKAQLEAARLKKRQAELEGMRVVDGNEIVDEAMENLRVLAAPAPGASREKVTVPAGGRQKKPLRGR
jgi:small subunit ribosomal protein S35